jgi:hypothetical protein
MTGVRRKTPRDPTVRLANRVNRYCPNIALQSGSSPDDLTAHHAFLPLNPRTPPK